MVTVENRAGRLIEVRQTGRVTVQEIQESFPKFQEILASSTGQFLMVTDWRGMRVLDTHTSQFLLGIMRGENARIERQVLIMDPSAIVGLQVRRLFSEAGGEERAVFESAPAAIHWMAPFLTPFELQALKRFASTGVAA